MELVRDHMVIDPALQHSIVRRILAGNFGDTPANAVENLGLIDLPDGQKIPLHLRHAADAILLDDHNHVALITRIHNPGAGLLALPGGFLDTVDGVVEHPLHAAIREAAEETGIDRDWLTRLGATPAGPRRYNRPFDIRQAWNNLPHTNIKKGDFFNVSTQGFRFKIPGNLHDLPLQAGDDAAAVRILKIPALTPDQFAVPDHLEMILTAYKTVTPPFRRHPPI
jgi:ADP-ribose pyrophosphatase YjhB (NUDIX family)